MPVCNCHGKQVLYEIEYVDGKDHVESNIVSLRPICSVTRAKLFNEQQRSFPAEIPNPS